MVDLLEPVTKKYGDIRLGNAPRFNDFLLYNRLCIVTK